MKISAQYTGLLFSYLFQTHPPVRIECAAKNNTVTIAYCLLAIDVWFTYLCSNFIRRHQKYVKPAKYQITYFLPTSLILQKLILFWYIYIYIQQPSVVCDVCLRYCSGLAWKEQQRLKMQQKFNPLYTLVEEGWILGQNINQWWIAFFSLQSSWMGRIQPIFTSSSPESVIVVDSFWDTKS